MNRARNKQSDIQTDYKPADRLARLPKPLYSEAKPKTSTPEMMVMIPNCP